MIKIISMIFLTALFSCLLSPVIYAQVSTTSDEGKYSKPIGPRASSLDTYEKKLKYWQSLTEEQRQVFRERAQNLSTEQLQAFREKQEEFDRLSFGEKMRVLNNYERFKHLTPVKRADLEKRYQRFEQLPEEIKMDLRRKALERRRWTREGVRPYFDREAMIRDRNQMMLQRREMIRKMMEERHKSYQDMVKKQEDIKKFQPKRIISPGIMRASSPQIAIKPVEHNAAPVMGILPEGGGLSDNGPSGEGKDKNRY